MNKKQLIVIFMMVISVCCSCSKANSISSIEGIWEPLSRVYLNFGNMTVKDDLLVWESGQKASFKIISSGEKGIILQFTDKILPKFHGDTYKFIRFVPKLGKATQETELEVSFYEESRKLDDKNAMFGVYIKVSSEISGKNE